MIGAFFRKLRLPFGRLERPGHPDGPDVAALEAALALEVAKRRSSDAALNETRATLAETRAAFDQARAASSQVQAALDETRAVLNETREAAENKGRVATDEIRRLREDAGRTREKLDAAETLLQGAEALKDAVVASALDAVLTIDDDGKVIEMNPAAGTMFAVDADGARGKSLEEIAVPPESRGKHRHGLNHFLTAIDSRILGQRVELPAMRSDGREFPAEAFILPVASGSRRFFVAHVRDLTERKNAERGIRQARTDRDILAALLRLPLGSASFDQIAEKVLSLVLAGRRATLGTDGAVFLADELTGEIKPSARRGRGEIPLDAIAPPLCAQAARNNEIVLVDGLYCLPIRGDNTVFGVLALSVPQDYRRTEAEERFLLAVAGILAPAVGRVRAEEALRQAIAQQERAIREEAEAFAREADRIRRAAEQAQAEHEEAERAVRVRSTLLANMSHDLRTALNAIIGFSNVLLHRAGGDLDPSRRRDYLEYIHESGRQLLDLIREALDLSRGEDDAPAIGPGDGVRLGYYAIHSTAGRGVQDLAEALFQRAIAADPGNAVVLENYSLFRTALRKDHERMDELYRRAIEADPENPLVLGGYAMFLSDVRKLDDQADKAFNRAVAAFPDHAPTLAAYAGFLARARDYDRAEALYQRAIAVDPGNSAILCDYGVFAWTVRGDDNRAAASLQKATEADPLAAPPRGAYAAYLLERGDMAKGLALLDEAIPGLPGETRLRALFLKYAHGASDDALAGIGDLLARRIRCPNFDRSREVRRLGDRDHPQPELLAALVQVISARNDADVLDRFPAWTSVARRRPETEREREIPPEP